MFNVELVNWWCNSIKENQILHYKGFCDRISAKLLMKTFRNFLAGQQKLKERNFCFLNHFSGHVWLASDTIRWLDKGFGAQHLEGITFRLKVLSLKKGCLQSFSLKVLSETLTYNLLKSTESCFNSPLDAKSWALWHRCFEFSLWVLPKDCKRKAFRGTLFGIEDSLLANRWKCNLKHFPTWGTLETFWRQSG